MIKKFNKIRCNITPCAINTVKKSTKTYICFILFS